MSQLHLNYLPHDYIVLHYIVLYYINLYSLSLQLQFSLSLPTESDLRVLLRRKNTGRKKTEVPPTSSYQHLLRDSTQTHLPTTARASDKHTHTLRERERVTHLSRGESQDSPNRALHFITHRDHAEHNPRQRYRAHIKSGEGTGFKELRVPLENRSGLKWGFVDSVRLESCEDARLGPVAVLRSLRRRRAQTLRAHGESPHTTLHNHFIITHINRKIAYEQILMVWMLKNMCHSISDYFNVL